MKILLADSADIAGNVLLGRGFNSQGEVLFRDAKIGGSFQTNGGIFRNPEGMALGCDRMKVSGGVFLSRPDSHTTFFGEVGLGGASIGSNLECDAGRFHNSVGAAIRADRITTGGGIFLRNKFLSEGEVRLINARIGTVLDCTDGRFNNPSGKAIQAESAHIGSSLALCGSFTCNGSAHFWGVQVGAGGGINCQAGKFSKLDLRHANIEGPLKWISITDPHETILDLRDASIASVEDDEASWPLAGNFKASGLKYGRFSDSVTDVSARLRWVRLDTENPPQMYRQLARIYMDTAEARCAREVLYGLEDLLHSRPGVNAGDYFQRLYSFLLKHILKWTIGYGHYCPVNG
jgi:hypothetical protein